MSKAVRMRYDRGTILVEGLDKLPHCRWDGRVGALRAPAFRYPEIKELLPHAIDEVMDPLPMPEVRGRIELKPFQMEAFNSWIEKGRGIIVLPTGAGKTYIALKAIERLRKSTLIIVPTIPLLDQWRDLLTKLGIEAGIIGGGKSELRPVTVITYDSAYLRSDELGNKFELVVFDEVHHLAAAGYIEIGESLASPYRMGLTATLEREDGRHSLLFPIVGGVVYRIGPKELAGTHLSEFDTVRIGVELSEEERAEYDKCLREYREALRDLKLRITGMEDFMKLIRMSSSNPTARKALLAWHRMRKIALNSRSKLDTLQSLLESHKDDKVIIFTEFNEMAEEISRRFLIPLITHRTDKKERKEVLDAFRVGSVTKIVTSKVLDEGLDVPDARVGIILGGTGSRREFVQRLGRILRKREGKRAVLYEVISRGTSEVRVSRRRRKALQR